jgi:putative PEP-CTERM system TPR-repeat lipoprotein
LQSNRNHHLTAAALVCALLMPPLSGCGPQSEADLIASAQSFMAKKDEKSAIINLKTVLQKNPQSGQVRFLLGQALFSAGDARSAVLELNKARELKFDDSQVLPTLAKALNAIGRAKEVTDGFAEVLLSNPKAAAELKATLAQAYYLQGIPDRAQVAVTAALRFDAKNLAARLLQARLTAGRGDFKQAIEITDALIADEPKRGEPWILKGELLWIGKSDADGGEKALRQALAIDPGQMRAHEALLRLLLQKRDLAAFKAQVAALSKTFPNRIETRFYSTHLALMEGDLKKAQEGAQQLMKVAPESAQVLQLAGAIELRAGAMLQAQTHLKRAVQLEPSPGLSRPLLAEAQLRAGQPGQTVETLKPLLEEDKPAAQVLALAAQAYLQDGDLDKAEALYMQAAKADPHDAKARVALALTQIGKGHTDLGYAQLESLAAADKTTYADLALISARARSNDLDAALLAVDRLQGKAPNTALPYLLRGRILLQRRDSAGARGNFERALAVDPMNYSAVSDLAAIDLAEKKPEDARKRFEAVLAREPRNVMARMAVIDLRQRAGAKPEEVEALLTEAVTANPEEAVPRLALIQHQLTQRHAKAALTAAQGAAAAFPDNLLVLDALGRSQLAAGDSLQAIQTFQKIAASQSASPLPHLRLAETYAASNDFTAAILSLRKALEISPKLLLAQRSLVQALLAKKRVSEALDVARQVQKQRPREAVGYRIEGEVQAGQKAWDPAIAAFRAALERDRSTPVAARLHALYTAAGRPADAARLAAAWESERPRDSGFILYLAELAMSRKDYPVAEARYRQLLVLRPEDALALNNVSWLLLQQGKPGAVPLAEKAHRLAPDQAGFMDTLATALAADKQLDRALEWQHKAVVRNPDSPSLRLNLAKLLIASGNKAKARAELQKLVALGGRFAGQAEVEVLMKGL